MFRLSVAFSGVCILSSVMLFAVIYRQTKAFETHRISAAVVRQAAALSQGTPEEIQWMVRTQFPRDYHDEDHNTIYSALFSPDGHLITGNIDHIPLGLQADGEAREVEVTELGGDRGPRTIIVAARHLPDGNLLVLGRGIGVLSTLADIVAGALLLGAIPSIGTALGVGLWLRRQAQRRVKAVNEAIDRIMQGDVHQRLPVQGVADEFDQLAESVNRMLAEIERLLADMQSISDNIAHDLRTPLARVRTVLERGRAKAVSMADLAAVSDRAIAGLDQAQSIITALLRIGEIESGQRRAAFSHVDLNEIVGTAADLYGPIADEKHIGFVFEADAVSPIYGDRDLMIEAVANLLDNAIKFVPEGGAVRLSVTDTTNGPVIQVTDNGPGIPENERDAVMTRFYRLDKSRHIKGHGLGLSIVLAIVKLHDFDLSVGDASPGCVFELRCHAPDRSLTAPIPKAAEKQTLLRRLGIRGGKQHGSGPSEPRATTQSAA
ncbi:MAG TPA: sensor histidine kinase [Acetobacteraceae bacterium]|jgi:signal transduction histidine kinase|nr:sensor histidine kinase [Acetobacteraceae bacterium]